MKSIFMDTCKNCQFRVMIALEDEREEEKLLVALTKFLVTLGDDRKVKGGGRCNRVKLEFQGISIEQNFFLFKLGSMDIIVQVD